MSIFTTELRYICEQYAGLDESVGLSRIDDVLDLAIPKVFDFDFPIYNESYREVLERKILTHFYTREIGYETVGRWKLALRSKMNDIMPYYNELYKRAATFGTINIFDNVSYDTSRSSFSDKSEERNGTNKGDNEETESESMTGEKAVRTNRDITKGDSYNREDLFSANSSDSVREQGNSHRDISKTVDGSKDGSKVDAVDKKQNSYGNVTDSGNSTDSINRDTNNSKDTEKTETLNKDLNTTGTYSENATSNDVTNRDYNSENTINKSGGNNEVAEGNITNNVNSTQNGSVIENVSTIGGSKENTDESVTSNSRNNSSNSNTANDTKLRLYSDTPSGALDFGDLGGLFGDGVTNNYLTNLTKDIGSSNSGGNALSVGDNKSNSDKNVNTTTQNNSTSIGDTNNTSNSNGQENRSENKSGKWNEVEGGNGSGNETVKKDISNNANKNTTERINGAETNTGLWHEDNKVTDVENRTGHSDNNRETNENITGSENSVGNWSEINESNEKENGSFNDSKNRVANGAKSESRVVDETRNGNENIVDSGNVKDNEIKNRGLFGSYSATQSAKGFSKSTESFMEMVKGKYGNNTYSAMFDEFRKAWVNVDMMIIEELNPLFMGLWE